MKNTAKRVAGIFVALMLIVSSVANVAAAYPHEELSGSVKKIVLTAEDFLSRQESDRLRAVSVANVGDARMSITTESVPAKDATPFTQTLKFDVTSLAYNANGSVNVNALAIKYYLKKDNTGINVGDNVLLKFAAKTSGETGNIGYRFFDEATNSDTLTKWSGFSISEAWNYYYLPATVVGSPDQLIFRFGAKLQTIYIADLEIINYGTNVELSKLPTGISAILPKENEPFNPTEGENMMITPDAFIENTQSIESTASNGACESTSVSFAGFEYTQALRLARSSEDGKYSALTELDMLSVANTKGRTLHLELYAKAKDEVVPVEISLAGANKARITATSFVYHIPTQWTKISVPYESNAQVAGVLFDFAKKGEILVAGLTLKCMADGVTITNLEHGQTVCIEEGYKRIDLDYLESGLKNPKVSNAVDVVTDGDYLYTINAGSFDILSIAEDYKNPVWMSEIGGLGTVRQMRLVPGKQAVVITARDFGMYIIDVTDKSNPVISARYDTLEMATGLAVTDSYAFVTCRMYGTEIIDISDIYNPRHVSVVYSGEAQSCEVVDGLLYAGVWGEKMVQVFDVSDTTSPVHIVNIPLTGNGDGLKVHNGILYASTGHHAERKYAYNKKGAIGWGYGNGMDIIDVSDVRNKNFERLSTVKIDGTFYRLGNDFWLVQLAQEGSSMYAYFANTYNGIFVYDVTNPRNPIRKAHISVVIRNNQPRYNTFKASHGVESATTTDFHFPYNTTEYLKSPVGGFVLTDDCMYIAGTATDIHILDRETPNASEALYKAVTPEPTGTLTANGEFYNFDAYKDDLWNFKHVVCGGQVYAVDEKDGIVYAACGVGGIKVYNENLTLLRTYEVDGVVGDIKVFGDRLYVAEGINGTTIYQIGEDKVTLTELSNYKSHLNGQTTIQPSKQVVLSTKGNYVLVHLGGQYAEVIDFRNLSAPVGVIYDAVEGDSNKGDSSVFSSGSAGLLYYRQLSNGLINNRYATIMWHMGVLKVLDLAEDANGEIPHTMAKVVRKTTGLHTMPNGIAPYGDKALMSGVGSYKLFDPLDPTLSETSTFTSYAPKDKNGGVPKNASGQNITVSGKPTIKGNILCQSQRYTGEFFVVDISNVESPVLLQYIKANCNPDLACVTDDFIYLPAGNAGLVRFTLKDDPNATLGDINSDKVINYKDLADFLKKMAKALKFKPMDTNGDGVVTLSDLSSFVKKYIAENNQ